MFFRIDPHPATPTFRQCFLYALPALLLGALVRISYLVAIPEAYVTPDTSSYITTGFDLWEKGTLTIAEKRRWWYPFCVAAAPLLPGTVAQSVAAVQHLCGWASIFGVAWIAGNLTRFWRLAIPLATLLAACSLQMLIYEHTFLAESLFVSAFIATAALSLPVHRLREPHRLFFFLLALTVLVGMRPPGRAVWLGAAILLVLVARHRTAWRWKNIAAALVATATAFTAGSDEMGSRLLLSSVLPLVDTEKPAQHELRQALKPLVVHAQGYGADYPWYQFYYKTRINDPDETHLGAAWLELMKDERKFGRFCRSLGIETVLAHPVAFTQFTLTKFLFSASSPAVANTPLGFNPPGFWEAQAKENEPRWRRKGDRMRWIYGDVDWPGWKKMAAERATRTLWIGPGIAWLDRTLPWATFHLRPGEDIVGDVRLTWLGWLAVAGFLACLRPALFVRSLMIWLPMLIYLGLTLGVGDKNARFSMPVHWCWICFAVIALDTLLSALAALRRTPIQPRAEALSK